MYICVRVMDLACVSTIFILHFAAFCNCFDDIVLLFYLTFKTII